MFSSIFLVVEHLKYLGYQARKYPLEEHAFTSNNIRINKLRV